MNIYDDFIRDYDLEFFNNLYPVVANRATSIEDMIERYRSQLKGDIDEKILCLEELKRIECRLVEDGLILLDGEEQNGK